MTVRLSDLVPPNGIELAKCPHGVGSFATKHFNAAEKIEELGYSVFWDKEAAPFCTLPIPKTKHYFGYEAGVHKWDCFLDHSDNPNVAYAIEYPGGKGFALKVWAALYATRKISPGEELFLNYHEFFDRVFVNPRYGGKHSIV